jgi:hypothetical protein
MARSSCPASKPDRTKRLRSSYAVLFLIGKICDNMSAMSTKSRNDKSAFLLAAEAFDDELESFYRAVQASLRAPLNSAKQLERAAQSLTQLAECEQRLGAASQTLSRAISAAHQQQLAQKQLVIDKAQAVNVRAAQFQQIMQGYQALGVAAMALNSEAAALVGQKKEAEGTLATSKAKDEWSAAVLALQDKMEAVAQTAQELIATSRSNDFEDIARQAESVRQQLLSVRAKLTAFTLESRRG